MPPTPVILSLEVLGEAGAKAGGCYDCRASLGYMATVLSLKTDKREAGFCSAEERGLSVWRHHLLRLEELSSQIKAIHCGSAVNCTPAPFH